MIHRKLATFLQLLILLSGCASNATQPQALTEPQAIEKQFAKASEQYRQKMAPIAQYFVTVCSPLADADYIACLKTRRNEISAASIYPEDASLETERTALEQQLLSGQIKRKEYRSKLEQLKKQYDARHLQQDIKNGRYSGQY